MIVKNIDFAGEGMRWGANVLPLPGLLELRSELDAATPRQYVHTAVFPEVASPVAMGRITVVNNILAGLVNAGPLGTRVGRGAEPAKFVPGLTHIDLDLERHGLYGRIDSDDENLMTSQGIRLAAGSEGYAAMVAGMAMDGVMASRETAAKTIIGDATSTTVATAWQLDGGDSAGTIDAAYEAMVTALGWRFPRPLLKVTLVGPAVRAAQRAADFLAQYRPTTPETGTAGALATYWDVGSVEMINSPTEAVTWSSQAILSLQPGGTSLGCGNTYRWDKSAGPVTPNVPGYVNTEVGYLEWFQVKLHRAGGLYVVESPEVSD